MMTTQLDESCFTEDNSDDGLMLMFQQDDLPPVSVKKLRGKALPWNFVEHCETYDNAFETIQASDYVKINCARNNTVNYTSLNYTMMDASSN